MSKTSIRRRIMRRFIFKFIPVSILIAIMLFTTGDSPGQLKKLKLKMISKILKREPALTTNLDDAVTEVPFLDEYNPSRVSPWRKKPSQVPGIQLALIPGCWGIRLKSYCLHAGKYRPGKGEGYLYAPLKGDWAPIIRSVLRKSALNPKIPQTIVQSLIWGILARTKIKDMPVSMKVAAAKLLTPNEIYTINGGALGLIPESLKQQALEGLPSAVRQVIEAEARIRDLLTSGIDTYEALERVAVRTGIAPRQEGDREVPGGRWSYHPEGYFVRYQPQGYSRTYMQISVPDFCWVKWDKKGRIVSVADRQGNTLETTYEDGIIPLTLRVSVAPIGYAFRSIRFSQKKSKSSTSNKKWTGRGWTFIIVPKKSGRISTDGQEYYSDFDKRRDWAIAHQAQVRSLSKQVASAKWRNELASKAVKLGIYIQAVQNFLDGQSGGSKEKVAAVHLLKESWQHLICLATMKVTPRKQAGSGYGSEVPFILPLGGYFMGSGGMGFSLGTASALGGGDGNDCEGSDPSGGGSVPGRQGNQRLGMGGPEDEPPDTRDKFGDGYKQGWLHGGAQGTFDCMNGRSYTPMPLKPIAPCNEEYWEGYEDGYNAGYDEGYRLCTEGKKDK